MILKDIPFLNKLVQIKDKHKQDVIIIITIIALIIVFRFIEGIVSNVIFVALLLGLIYYTVRYVLGIDMFMRLTGQDTSEPELSIVFDKTSGKNKSSAKPTSQSNKPKPQVFNISQNILKYDDARTVCSAYGARLATYSEIEDAYNHGAGWCNYGWSEGQMALFPTQKSIFNKLQQSPGHEHDCGRPGINGGYMANPDLKFGANCFGIKPNITDTEKLIMDTHPIVPKTQQEIDTESKLQYWQNNLSSLLVAPFNRKNWSRY